MKKEWLTRTLALVSVSGAVLVAACSSASDPGDLKTRRTPRDNSIVANGGVHFQENGEQAAPFAMPPVPMAPAMPPMAPMPPMAMPPAPIPMPQPYMPPAPSIASQSEQMGYTAPMTGNGRRAPVKQFNGDLPPVGGAATAVPPREEHVPNNAPMPFMEPLPPEPSQPVPHAWTPPAMPEPMAESAPVPEPVIAPVEQKQGFFGRLFGGGKTASQQQAAVPVFPAPEPVQEAPTPPVSEVKNLPVLPLQTLNTDQSSMVEPKQFPYPALVTVPDRPRPPVNLRESKKEIQQMHEDSAQMDRRQVDENAAPLPPVEPYSPPASNAALPLHDGPEPGSRASGGVIAEYSISNGGLIETRPYAPAEPALAPAPIPAPAPAPAPVYQPQSYRTPVEAAPAYQDQSSYVAPKPAEPVAPAVAYAPAPVAVPSYAPVPAPSVNAYVPAAPAAPQAAAAGVPAIVPAHNYVNTSSAAPTNLVPSGQDYGYGYQVQEGEGFLPASRYNDRRVNQPERGYGLKREYR